MSKNLRAILPNSLPNSMGITYFPIYKMKNGGHDPDLGKSGHVPVIIRCPPFGDENHVPVITRQVPVIIRRENAHGSNVNLFGRKKSPLFFLKRLVKL